jgi:uncharacterized repeat protein (TIGR03803 family)
LGYASGHALNPKTGAVTTPYPFKGKSNNDGEVPKNRLINLSGRLYGTTRYGGASHCAYGCGTVYSIVLATGTETVREISSCNSLIGPWSPLGMGPVRHASARFGWGR